MKRSSSSDRYTLKITLFIENWLSNSPDDEIMFLVPSLPLIKQTEKALWPYLSKFRPRMDIVACSTAWFFRTEVSQLDPI